MRAAKPESKRGGQSHMLKKRLGVAGTLDTGHRPERIHDDDGCHREQCQRNGGTRRLPAGDEHGGADELYANCQSHCGMRDRELETGRELLGRDVERYELRNPLLAA